MEIDEILGDEGRALGRQAERTFLAATVARAATTMSSNSFFMAVIVVTAEAWWDPGVGRDDGARGRACVVGTPLR